MRYRLFFAFLFVMVAVITSAIGLPKRSTAQPTIKSVLENPLRPAEVAQPSLPIRLVILFNSGVGYFQREGDVTGKAQIDLAFPAGDVNDLLKSLVVQDLGGGKVSSVTYDNQDPVEKTLQSFGLDLTYNPTFGQLLNQARGEKVEVAVLADGGAPAGALSGVIVGMESEPAVATPGDPAHSAAITARDQLNLLSADGVQRIPLNRISRVRFLNPALQNDFNGALGVLASAHDTQKKHVRLHLTGEDKRKVRVGYVAENPIWKATYRLALDAAGKALLQGWGLIENVGDDDWNDVRVVLVSGRPISYQMDLYPPLYVPRPLVEPELFASLRPPNYNGPIIPVKPSVLGLSGVGGGGLGLGGLGLGLGIGGLGGQLGQGGFQGIQGGMTNLGAYGGFAGFGGNQYQQGQFGQSQRPANPPDVDNEGQRLTFQELQKRRDEKRKAQGEAATVGKALAGVDFKEGVDSVASAEEIGVHFHYAIGHPVSLPRRKSAMVPIVNKDVQVNRVSIFNSAVHAKYALLGLKLKNTSGLQLMQGPVTVYDGGSYAGDARIMDMQPNEERLLAFAVDLGTEVKVEGKTEPGKLIAVKIVKGVLELTSRTRDTKAYLIRNRSGHDRQLLIEHPVRPDWKLVVPKKPSEQSRDVYRFDLKAASGTSQRFEVAEEHDSLNMIALLNKEDKEIDLLLAGGPVNPQIKEALHKAGALRGRLTDTFRELTRNQEELRVILEDQNRLRQDLKTVPANSALQRRYLEKLEKQESQIEKVQEETRIQKQLYEKQMKEYENYLVGLNVGDPESNSKQ
jgi:hypothetical protein